MKFNLIIGLILLNSFVYADSLDLPSANEIRAGQPTISEPSFKRIVEAIKNAAANGETDTIVDLPDTDFAVVTKYMYLLQNKGYTVDFARGKSGINSAIKISWDISLRNKGFQGAKFNP